MMKTIVKTGKSLLMLSLCVCMLLGCSSVTKAEHTSYAESSAAASAVTEEWTLPSADPADLKNAGADLETLLASGKADTTASASTVNASYITPEQFGAKGDGKTDDTAAFQKCMSSSTEAVYLTKTYLIKGYVSTSKTKSLYASPYKGGPGASIICNPSGLTHSLSFSNGVSFENISIYSTSVTTGKSPHGETYKHTSNDVFVEVWNSYGTFRNCSFTNALIAVRGRKSSSSTVIPKNITVENCTFTECKIPIQGYCENTIIKNSSFINDGALYRSYGYTGNYGGDVYSGDHCIYIERYGCKTVTVEDCTVNTKNCDSGAAFQIYGNPKSGDSLPVLSISRTVVNANGIASVSAADVRINECVFQEQKAGEYIVWVESGKLVMKDSQFNHSYAFSYAGTSVKPYAYNCSFTLLKNLDSTRCNFPYYSYKCTYTDWGGNIRQNGVEFDGCIFTKSGASTLNKLYISNSQGYKISLKNTYFKSGDTITNNRSAVTAYTNCGTF